MNPQERLSCAIERALVQDGLVADLPALCEAMAASWGTARRSGAWTQRLRAIAKRSAPAGFAPWIPTSLSALDCACAFDDARAVERALGATPLGAQDAGHCAAALAVAFSCGAFDAARALTRHPGAAALALAPEAKNFEVDALKIMLAPCALAADATAVREALVAGGAGSALEAAALARPSTTPLQWAARLAGELWFEAPREPILASWACAVAGSGPLGWQCARTMARAAEAMGGSWRMERAALEALDAPRGRGDALAESGANAPWGALLACAAIAEGVEPTSRWRESLRSRALAKIGQLRAPSLGGVEQATAAAESWQLRAAAKTGLTRPGRAPRI